MQGVIHVIAQSHIDVAWLWRYDPETIYRCCKPTFTLATDNMDKYPDYTFSQSQVPLYEATADTFPKLFEKIRKYIKEGRWEIVGGMYIEFEGGEPCGESIVRQCVVGKRYFMEELGIDVKTGWQEDAWSHPWQMPQIFKKCGISSYMFKRGAKGERLFWWQSPDGSKVLACKPHHGNPSDSWKEFFSNMKEHYGVKDVMVRIGRGDHGGGPTPTEIEAVKKFAQEVSPEIEVKFDTFNNFMETLVAQDLDVPVINDELGFELTGDLTNCGEIKKSNRECEILLLNAEKFCSIASTLFGDPYPSEELYESWKKVLFNQFHDIIGGSGIPPVCRDAARFYEIVRESGERLLKDSIDTILENVNTEGEGVPVFIVNPLPWERTELAEVTVQLSEASEAVRLLDEKGSQVPIQIVEEQEKYVKFIFIAEGVPSLGYKIYRVIKGRVSYANPFSIDGSKVESELFSIEIDPDTGCLKSILDKRNGKEILHGSDRGNMLVAIEDNGDSEGRFVRGSDTIAKPPGKAWELLSEPSIEICESGPVRTKVRIKRSFHNSSFTQDIVLYSSIARVDFNLTVDWHDVHWMIKLAFPINVENAQVTYDSAYGSVVRPADGLECSAQKWVDLSSPDYGIALLNDSRYGYDVEGNTIRMSILRSPTSPAYNTDEGVHLIGYSIYPHSGDWRDGDVMRRGYEFNYPLTAVVANSHPGELPSSHSFMKVEPENVIVEVLKKAYDTDELVVRLYETRGESCSASITMPCEISSACETDLLESKIGNVEFEENVLKTRVGANEIKTLKFLPGQ
jgi:alpha-mannosidase